MRAASGTSALEVELIGQLSGRVDAQLREVLAPRDMELYAMMSYHLGWGNRPGEDPGTPLPPPALRRHGVGCLVAAMATSADGRADALPAAAAVELVASFVEIHDDIQGGHPRRNGRDAVWWVWGPAQAINAGDGMHALARLTMLDLRRSGLAADVTVRAMQALDRASLRMCEGRFRDMEAQERVDMSVEGYLEMARDKSGSLMSGALRLGALLGSGGDEAAAEAFAEAGADLGVAMQAAGDVRDLFGDDGGALSEEVLNKKKLLPVVHAFASAGRSERRRLGDVYFKRVLEPSDVAEVRSLVEDLGGRERAEEVVADRRRAALDVLGHLDLAEGGLAAVDAFADAVIRGR